MDVHDEDFIDERRVENPHSSYAQFRADVMAGRGDAGVQRTNVNLKTVMGGFLRFYGTEAECRACAVYKTLYEAAQLGGARAVDPGREPVDGGGSNPEAVFINGADARAKLAAIDSFLKAADVKRLRFVVIQEWGPTSYAKWRYGMRSPDGRTVSMAKVEVRAIAERLAMFLQLEGETKTNRRGVRADGDRATEFVNDPDGSTFISTRKTA